MMLAQTTCVSKMSLRLLLGSSNSSYLRLKLLRWSWRLMTWSHLLIIDESGILHAKFCSTWNSTYIIKFYEMWLELLVSTYFLIGNFRHFWLSCFICNLIVIFGGGLMFLSYPFEHLWITSWLIALCLNFVLMRKFFFLKLKHVPQW